MPAVRKFLLVLLALGLASQLHAQEAGRKRYLYVVVPGIRNYLEFGGAGILVFDIDHGHKFVRRIPPPASQAKRPENIKGVVAHAATRRLYLTTLSRVYALDLVTDKVVWEKALPGGCDRLAVTRDGKTLYVPSLEGPHWNVVAAADGALIRQVKTDSGAHNTAADLGGARVFLAGLRSPLLAVVDVRTGKLQKPVGPFSAPVRPFTVNGDGSRVYVNVNGLLGFEVGDVATGAVLHRVAVPGYKAGPTKRHGCPSHGVGLTPDETEVWVCDAPNSRVHVFDLTATPPRLTHSLPVREQPGWVTFSVDGKYAYPSTGEVIDAATKKTVATLTDEEGREVHSEKVLEIDFEGGVPVLAGDQFGLGRRGGPADR